MQITRGTEYAIRAVLYLTRHEAEAPILLADVAGGVLAPANYLSNIFQSLCRFNIVRAHRGARRGYSLARPPEEITLLEIVEALEGPVALTCCTADPVPSCPFSPDCHVTEVFRDLQRVMVERLSSTTLAQVARRGAADGR